MRLGNNQASPNRVARDLTLARRCTTHGQSRPPPQIRPAFTFILVAAQRHNLKQKVLENTASWRPMQDCATTQSHLAGVGFRKIDRHALRTQAALLLFVKHHCLCPGRRTLKLFVCLKIIYQLPTETSKISVLPYEPASLCDRNHAIRKLSIAYQRRGTRHCRNSAKKIIDRNT